MPNYLTSGDRSNYLKPQKTPKLSSPVTSAGKVNPNLPYIPSTTKTSTGTTATAPSWDEIRTTSNNSASNLSNAGNVIGGGAVTSAEGLGGKGTGWMSGIKPDAAASLFENPDAFLRQVMSRMGVDPDVAIGALQQAAPMARNMNELAMIMLGGNPDFEQGSWDQTGNWMANFLANSMSPNGRYVDFGQGMNNLMNTRTTGADKMSALGSILGIDDPAGQAQAFNSLATSLASASLHPLWARAFQDELGRQGDAYVSKNATSLNMDPYNVWLQSRGY